MSLSHEAEHDEQAMTRYFLGLLPAHEAEQLDEQSLADTDLARRLRAVEHDLVDAYVRGALDDTTRQQFERSYLTSPRRREKVRFAESLRRAVDKNATPTPTQTPTPTPTPSPTPAPVRRSRFSFGWGPLAFAATILLIVSGILGFEALRLRQQLTVVETQRAAQDRLTHELQQQLNVQIAARTEATKELDRVQALLGEAMQRAVVSAAALILAPQTRSIATVPTLRIRPGMDNATITLLMEANPYSRYRVVLKDPGTNAVLWRSDPLPPSLSTKDGPTVSVIVPTRQLKAQHYSLELSGTGPTDAAGRDEIMGSYAFQVLTR
jgi:hypothetical protein